MGHVVNPISFRLGFNRYWNSAWGLSDIKNYGYLANQDVFIKKVIFAFFEQWDIQSANFIVSDVRILRKFFFLDLFIYIYDSTWEEFLGDLYYHVLDVYRYSNLSPRNLKFKKKALEGSFKAKFSRPSKSLRRVPGSVKFWDRKFILRKAIKVQKAFKISRNHFKDYLQALFLFYISYIRIYIQRPLLTYLKHVLLFNLYKFFSGKVDIRVFFLGLTNDSVTASFLSKFISVKLERSYFLFRVLSTINRSLRVLMKKRFLVGYRIKISGRYSRNQKAVVLINGIGSFSRSAIDSRVDYSFNIAKLRYSVCGIKVWLVYSSRNGFLRKLKQRKLQRLIVKDTSKTKNVRSTNLRKLSRFSTSYLII